MSDEEKMVKVTITSGNGKQIVKMKCNIDNIFRIGSERDKILDSHSWLDAQVTQLIPMYFFEEVGQKYQDMEKILKGMDFSEKLKILKDLKLIDNPIYADLCLIAACRNKFVHPPIIESVDELIYSDSIKMKKFKTVPKQISDIKDSKEFMEVYEKVCKSINKIFEEWEIKWALNSFDKMYNKLSAGINRVLK